MFEVVGPSFGQDLAMSYAISHRCCGGLTRSQLEVRHPLRAWPRKTDDSGPTSAKASFRDRGLLHLIRNLNGHRHEVAAIQPLAYSDITAPRVRGSYALQIRQRVRQSTGEQAGSDRLSKLAPARLRLSNGVILVD